MCLLIVWEIMFTIGESRAISHRNDTEQQVQQVAAIPCRRKFSSEMPLEDADKHSSASGSKKTTTKQREHLLAQRRQRRQHSDHKHVQRQRQNTTITLYTKPMKRWNTDCRTLDVYSQNKTLLERIFGHGCIMRMILLTCLIAAK